MTLDAIQVKVVDLIKAAFHEDLVVADYCRKATDQQQESALATRGICWAISPIIKGKVISAAGKKACIKVYVIARLRTNPTVNESSAKKEPIASIATAITSVLNWRSDGQSTLKLSDDDDCLESAPEREDSGLLSWDIRFTYTLQV